jgi:endonuclease-3
MPAGKSKSSKPAAKKAAPKKAAAKGKPAAAPKKKAPAAAAKKPAAAAGKKKVAATAKSAVKKKAPAAVAKKKPAAAPAKKKPDIAAKAKAAKPAAPKKAAAPVKVAKAPAKAAPKAPEKPKAPLKLAAPAKETAKAPSKIEVKGKSEEKSAAPAKAPKLVVAKKESAAPMASVAVEEMTPSLEEVVAKPVAVKVKEPKAPKAPKLTVVKNEAVEVETQAEDSAPKPSMLGMPLSSSNEPPLEGGVLVEPKVATEGMQLLLDRYPDAQCELNFANAFQLLIAVILSAQTTDANVNRVTPTLFKKFPTAKALSQADSDEVKGIIRSTGYFNSKAKSIQECAKALSDKFNGEVPQDIEQLVTLPGVGRKTANVVLGVAFDKPGWTVDTHVQRLSRRLGYTLETDPEKIEMDLQKLFPENEWTKDSITLIWHGRRCCFARNPNCAECPVNKLCPSSRVK